MPSFIRWFAVPTLVLLLSACGTEDPEIAPVPEPSASAEAAPRSAPGEAPPVRRDRGAATTNSPVEPEARQQARAERDRLRDRHARERLHWDEETMTAQLDLDAGQLQALQQARQTLLQERVAVRTGLQAQRQFRTQAEATADKAQLADIETRSHQLRTQLDLAEQAWQDALRSILDADQLERFAEQRPELVQPSGDG